MKLRIMLVVAVLALAGLTGCASGPRYTNHANTSFAGGTYDLQAQTRGYAHSSAHYGGPLFDYRNVLSDPGHF